MVTIKVSQDGPYLVEGDDVRLIDWNGDEYQLPNRCSFALCRCGGSMRKPLCDSTHSRTGFKAAQAAIPGSVDRPARGTNKLTQLQSADGVEKDN